MKGTAKVTIEALKCQMFSFPSDEMFWFICNHLVADLGEEPERPLSHPFF